MTDYVKSPEAKLDYSITWADMLVSAEAISASEWRAEPSDLASPASDLILSGEIHSDDLTTVWVEGGSPGIDYVVINDVILSSGRRDTRSFSLYVMQT